MIDRIWLRRISGPKRKNKYKVGVIVDGGFL
jgi:hypothetical protein